MFQNSWNQRLQGGDFVQVFIQVTIRGSQSFQALTMHRAFQTNIFQLERTASLQMCLKCPIFLFNMHFALQFNPFICKEFDIALLERLALPQPHTLLGNYAYTAVHTHYLKVASSISITLNYTLQKNLQFLIEPGTFHIGKHFLIFPL